jgi:polyhydroxybutyrate depolymerase
MTTRLALSGLFLFTALGCRPPICSEEAPGDSGNFECRMADWDDRDYLIDIPTEGEGARPLVLFIHGGGGKKESMNGGTCPEGDEESDSCFVAQANARGYVVVTPDGTSAAFDALRTWNAGGGIDNFRCVSGKACAEGVDDIAYFKALIQDVAKVTDIDEKRIYATGLSNGGAMSHRLACDLAEQISAVAPVAGGNQAEVAPGCSPSRAVPIMHHHGTDDPCWKYQGGAPDCPTGQKDLEHISVKATIEGEAPFEGWVQKHECGPQPEAVAISDHDDGEVSSEEKTWRGCKTGAEVVLITTEGGGHAWPRGSQYLDEDTVGRVPMDLDLNKRILDFFDRFSLP